MRSGTTNARRPVPVALFEGLCLCGGVVAAAADGACCGTTYSCAWCNGKSRTGVPAASCLAWIQRETCSIRRYVMQRERERLSCLGLHAAHCTLHAALCTWATSRWCWCCCSGCWPAAMVVCSARSLAHGAMLLLGESWTPACVWQRVAASGSRLGARRTTSRGRLDRVRSALCTLQAGQGCLVGAAKPRPLFPCGRVRACRHVSRAGTRAPPCLAGVCLLSEQRAPSPTAGAF